MKYISLLLIFLKNFIIIIDGYQFNYISHIKYPPPPPVDDAAKMARYIVHYSDWGALAHISKQQNITGLPMARVYSISDGPINQSSGEPYLYISPVDGVVRDLKTDDRCSLTVSMAQTDFCTKRNLDPQDPKCPQVILTGYFVFLRNNTDEWKFATSALFTRHPEMKIWPKSHEFTFGKVYIKNIILVDNVGGSKYPSVHDYFKAKPNYENSEQVSVDMVY